jgi:diguanylate cyclase (GGDEF)-like protein
MQYQTSASEMFKELKGVRDIFYVDEQTALDKSQEASLSRQAMLDIGLRLQMSLELEWVVNQFMERVSDYLLFDGYSFRLEQPTVNLQDGRQKGHQCRYNLSMDEMEMGSVILYRGRKFGDSEMELLEYLLCSLLFPLRNAIHYRKATLSAHLDPLTGVKNRFGLEDALSREMNLANRKQQSFSILVIDLDHFKKVNDTYGHSAGDKVLKNVADQIKNSIRNTDQLFRFGGEEFVVLLNDSGAEDAAFIADRILNRVRSSKVTYNKQDIAVSTSIGLACLQNGDSAEDLFNRADCALYAAKKSGRDQLKEA